VDGRTGGGKKLGTQIEGCIGERMIHVERGSVWAGEEQGNTGESKWDMFTTTLMRRGLKENERDR